jgi:hypothetical protein
MKLITFLIYSIFLLFSTNSFAQKDCSFYLKEEIRRVCLENKGDATDYFTHYGYFYCRKFNAVSTTNISSKLKSFINKTRPCLQKSLNHTKPKKLSCEKAEEYAFDTHPTCYAKGGYCKLDKNDRLKVLSIVAGINLLFKVDKSLLQYLGIHKECNDKNEYSGILESFKIIYEDKENLKTVGLERIKDIFFNIPKTSEKIIDFFKKAVSILKYGVSNSATNTVTNKYLELKYEGKLTAEKINCFDNFSNECMAGLDDLGLSKYEYAAYKKTSGYQVNQEQQEDINIKLKKISELER